jgi:hypothetical protein
MVERKRRKATPARDPTHGDTEQARTVSVRTRRIAVGGLGFAAHTDGGVKFESCLSSPTHPVRAYCFVTAPSASTTPLP